jgi:hypothetical protein
MFLRWDSFPEFTHLFLLREAPSSNIRQKIGYKNVRPTTCHEGPEGVYEYSSTRSLTSALDEGGSLTPRLGRFTLGETITIVQNAGWATKQISTGAENLVPTGTRSKDRPARSFPSILPVVH